MAKRIRIMPRKELKMKIDICKACPCATNKECLMTPCIIKDSWFVRICLRRVSELKNNVEDISELIYDLNSAFPSGDSGEHIEEI